MKLSHLKLFFKSRIRLIATLLIVCNLKVHCQYLANEVLNGGFEKMRDCNFPLPFLEHALGWRTLDSSGLLATQIHNKCISNVPYGHTTPLFQYPFKGDGFAGATFYCPPSSCNYFYSRGYLKNRLKEKLIANRIYCVKFYYNVSNASSYGISDIQAYFGDDNLDTIKQAWCPLTYLNPQIKNAHSNYANDTLGWTPLTGTFTAQGNEKYAVFGNFTSNSLIDSVVINPTLLPNIITDICIDHVSCIPIDLEAYAGPDKNCIVGDSVFIGREPDVEIDESCVWYQLNANGTLSAPIQTIAGLYVKPTYTNSSQTETFVVRQQLWCSGVKWDTVLVHRDFVGIPNVSSSEVENDMSFFPNPASNKITFEYKDELRIQSISIKNILGQQMFQLTEPKKEIDVSLLSTGLYYLRVETNKGSKTFKLQKE